MSLPSRFVKMAGGGNDFLVFEGDGRALTEEDRARLALVCRRGLSVGADGALFLSVAGEGRVRVDYFNADGGARHLLRQRHALRRPVRRAPQPRRGRRAGAGDRMGTDRVPRGWRVGDSLASRGRRAAGPDPHLGPGPSADRDPDDGGRAAPGRLRARRPRQVRDRPVRAAPPPSSGHGRGRQRQLRPRVGRQSSRGAHLRARRRRGDPVLRVRSRRRGDRRRRARASRRRPWSAAPGAAST